MIGLEIFAGIMVGGVFFVACMVAAYDAAERIENSAALATIVFSMGFLFPTAVIVGAIAAFAQ